MTQFLVILVSVVVCCCALGLAWIVNNQAKERDKRLKRADRSNLLIEDYTLRLQVENRLLKQQLNAALEALEATS